MVASQLNDYFLEILLGERVPSEDQSKTEPKTFVEGVRLNEWGALLLYDQILVIVNLFEDALLILVDESIKFCFSGLLWAIKILTLDRPADIKRCGLIPGDREGGKEGERYVGDVSDWINNRVAKQLLRCRIEFPREVIDKLKFNEIGDVNPSN